MVFQTLQIFEILREAFDVLLAIRHHGASLRKVNALASEPVAIFEEVLQLLILGVQVIEHKVFVFNNFNEVIKSNTFLIQFFNVVFDKVVDII
jgi:hypothetical protein